jgi:hypothetical protein
MRRWFGKSDAEECHHERNGTDAIQDDFSGVVK